MTASVSANIGTMPALNADGNSRPVLLSNGACGVSDNRQTIETATTISNATSTSAALSRVCDHLTLVRPLRRKHPHAMAISNIHANGHEATMSEKLPTIKRTPSPESSEWTPAVIVALSIHDSSTTNTSATASASVNRPNVLFIAECSTSALQIDYCPTLRCPTSGCRCRLCVVPML